MGVFVRHEPCPRCGSRDNLGRYDDGSAHCFGCGYYERANKSPYVAKKQREALDNVENEDVCPPMPDDITQDYGPDAMDWVSQYGIKAEELYKNNVVYSQRYRQLIFPFFDGRTLVAWTARNFREGSQKYFTQGAKNYAPRIYLSVDNVGSRVPDRASRRLVLVEDCLSALKCARVCDSMPVLGVTLPRDLLARLRASYGFLDVWLDSDKMDNAQRIAEQAKMLGLSTRVLWTELDPKEYSDTQIKERLLGENNDG